VGLGSIELARSRSSISPLHPAYFKTPNPCLENEEHAPKNQRFGYEENVCSSSSILDTHKKSSKLTAMLTHP
jgi:hypothetical protein